MYKNEIWVTVNNGELWKTKFFFLNSVLRVINVFYYNIFLQISTDFKELKEWQVVILIKFYHCLKAPMLVQDEIVFIDIR